MNLVRVGRSRAKRRTSFVTRSGVVATSTSKSRHPATAIRTSARTVNARPRRGSTLDMMRSIVVRVADGLLWAITLGTGACAGTATAIPALDGPLGLDVRFPADATPVAADSVATWGTVGTGRATLHLNGQTIPVERNGTFAAFVAVPTSELPTLHFVATKGDDSVMRDVAMSRSVAIGNRPRTESPPRPWERWVRLRRLPSDTADSATQWRPIYTRWRPRGAVALPITQGMRLPADVRTDSAIRVVLANDLRVWIPAVDADTTAPPDHRSTTATALHVLRDSDEVRVVVPLEREVHASVELSGDRLDWTLYGVPWREAPPADAFGSGGAIVELSLTHLPLGWRTEYRQGAMILTVRRPLTPDTTLRGLRVLVDPGHPPDGTTDPAGLTEDSGTLAVAQVVVSRLKSLGATVMLTRDDLSPVSLEARAAIVSLGNPHLVVSIHANSPGPGRPPSAVDATQVYWMHGNSRVLARFMAEEVARQLGVEQRGAYTGEYAVLRPTWAPAVIVEGLPLVLPERQAFLRSTAGVATYVEGIVAGVRRWARSPDRFTLQFPHTRANVP